MKLHHYLSTLVKILLLSGCSAALVPAVSDTTIKISQIQSLMQQNRMIPAERMLREIHESNPIATKDYVARGEAHLLYWAILKNKDWMQARAFSDIVTDLGGPDKIDQAAEKHLDLAIRDYQVAKNMLIKENDSFGLSNIEWRLSGIYFRKNERELGCQSLDESLIYNGLATKEHPEMHTVISGKFSS